MKTAFGVYVFLLAIPLAGQWLNYPTPGIPRLPEGSANLSAKAARLIERFRRVDFGYKILSVTIDDPKHTLLHGRSRRLYR